MPASASDALADPSLGNDSNRARALLLDGADVGHDFNAAVQNAARGGHKDVLKLMIVADEIMLAARDDARRNALIGGHQDIDEMLARIDPSVASLQRKMQQDFAAAVKAGDKPKASNLLDQMVTLVFTPRP